MLDHARKDRSWTATREQTSAIVAFRAPGVLDSDEKVLDKSPAEADSVKLGGIFEPARWTDRCDTRAPNLFRAEPSNSRSTPRSNKSRPSLCQSLARGKGGHSANPRSCRFPFVPMSTPSIARRTTEVGRPKLAGKQSPLNIASCFSSETIWGTLSLVYAPSRISPGPWLPRPQITGGRDGCVAQPLCMVRGSRRSPVSNIT